MTTPLEAAKSELKRSFGYDDFRPGQGPVVEALLSGKDALAVMPTGAGKSLCYQIPALLMDGLSVIVSPLVALMEDQVAALQLNGIAADTINSARDRETNVAAWRRAAAGETRLLYLSPERLMTDRMITALQRLSPAMFAIDEAHCISRWGASFRPEYEQLGALREAFPKARLAAFTATADPATREDIVGKLFRTRPETFVAGFDRPNIALGAEARTQWRDQLTQFLNARPGQSGIIYALSRKNVDEIAATLIGQGFNALPYHAGMDAAARSHNQDRFMTETPVVMVATIAFGMGIDKPDIRYVVHTHLPANIEAYYQEIGRAGRDGAPAETMLLYGLDDIRLRRRFVDEDGSDDATKRREHKRLDALVAYAEASTCRRIMLLNYFGDSIEPCGNCDICLDPPVMMDATEPARQALSVMEATGQRFGAAHIIDILRGSENRRMQELGHDRIAAHGIGRDRAKPWWQAFMRQLVSAGHLVIDIQGFGGFQISASGQAILRGESQFECRKITARQSTAPSRRKTSTPTLAPENEDLLTRLKAHRLELARTRSVPPYVISHARTLIEMAEQKPQNREAFLDLSGVGKSKADHFSESFLAILHEAEV
ncbi:MAG: DNA helicase RecQ [Paracoccaceae bacterium]